MTDLRDYGLLMEIYRLALRLRVRLCPPTWRELLRETLLAEANLAVDEETLSDLDDGDEAGCGDR